MSVSKLLFEQWMMPLWSAKLVYNESVLMTSRDGECPSAALLFEPEQMISVTNSYLDMEYREGIDWVYEGGRLKLTRQSRAAYMTSEELYVPAPVEGATYPLAGGGYSLWNRGNRHQLIDKQLAVTYRHAGNWEGPIPASFERQLLKVKRKLEGGEPVKLVLYGDSIAEGAESSARHRIPPYMPTWGELLVQHLQGRYDSEITLINAASGGKTSLWGVEHVQSLVSEQRPDLVILAFGMNDGSQRVEAGQYETHMIRMMDNISLFNPDAEFILVSTMLPNPELQIAAEGMHRSYLPVLRRLTGQHAALADLTGITATLLQRKKFVDITSNNVNHPNDYLIRWYAQAIAALLC